MRLLCISDPSALAVSLHRFHNQADGIVCFYRLFGWRKKGVYLVYIDEQSNMNYHLNPSHFILIKIKSWILVSTNCFHRYLISLGKLANWK